MLSRQRLFWCVPPLGLSFLPASCRCSHRDDCNLVLSSYYCTSNSWTSFFTIRVSIFSRSVHLMRGGRVFLIQVLHTFHLLDTRLDRWTELPRKVQSFFDRVRQIVRFNETDSQFFQIPIHLPSRNLMWQRLRLNATR